MNGFPTTNGTVRSSAIYRTFRNYRINKLIFIQPHRVSLTGEVKNLEETPKQNPTNGEGRMFIYFQLIGHATPARLKTSPTEERSKVGAVYNRTEPP